jgi:Holliday junction resolvasome RuvABC endonuclease subunit
MRIIGLDLSITATGYCIVDEEKKMIDSGVVTTAPKDFSSDIERFDKIATDIFSKVGEHCCDAAFIENYAYAARGNLARIAELNGIIKHDFFCTWSLAPGEKLFVVAPSTLKKYIIGKGIGEKSLILKCVLTKWGVDIDNDNIADAYGLARVGVDFLRYHKDDTYTCKHKYEDECVVAIGKQNGIKLERRKKNDKSANQTTLL